MACKSDQYGTQWRNDQFGIMQIIKIVNSSSLCGVCFIPFLIFSVISDWYSLKVDLVHGAETFFSNVICTQNCPRDQYPQVLFYRVSHRRQEFRVLDDFYKNEIFSRLLMSNSTLEKIPFVKIQMV